MIVSHSHFSQHHFFQGRTSLKYNLPLITSAFMIFHILPCKQHTLLCPPTSLPFIFTSSQASSLSLTITPGIMSPFVLPSLVDTISWSVFCFPLPRKLHLLCKVLEPPCSTLQCAAPPGFRSSSAVREPSTSRPRSPRPWAALSFLLFLCPWTANAWGTYLLLG